MLSGGAAVEVLAHPLAQNSALPTMRVRATRLIKAEGANVSIKHPMQVGVSSRASCCTDALDTALGWATCQQCDAGGRHP